MTEPILCLVVFFFVLWIVLLESRVQHMSQELKRLQEKLSRYVNRATGDVEVTEGRRLPRADANVVDRKAGRIGARR